MSQLRSTHSSLTTDERYSGARIAWLRAAVLGANDGLVSTASLIVGVAGAQADHKAIMISGLAGLVAGAMSMAAGEYVSVSSQADAENAELEKEKQELREDAQAELVELAGIYQKRGLDKELSLQVARQLHKHNALEAHARDELGISEHSVARPIQAAMASAVSFAIGAASPLVLAYATPFAFLIPVVAFSSLVLLASLGAVSAKLGGAPVGKAVVRVTFWGALAIGITIGIGALFGAVV